MLMEDNTRMDFTKIGWEDMEWIHLAQDKLMVGPCEQGNDLLASNNDREVQGGP
jgi:hypothetical protein